MSQNLRRVYKLGFPIFLLSITLLTSIFAIFRSHEFSKALSSIFELLFENKSVIITLFTVLTSVISAIYLNTASSDEKIYKYAALRRKIEELEAKTSIQESFQDNSYSRKINERINNLIDKNINSERILETLKKSIGFDMLVEQQISKLENDFNNQILRNKTEINRLTKNANLNLIFGSTITIGTLWYFGYHLFDSKLVLNTLTSVLSFFIPRSCVIISVELLGFFFLKIYKSNLAEIKYYHNETANHVSKLIALKLSLYNNKDNVLDNCINNLVATERNFILKKDESSIELEREKIDVKNNNGLIDLLKTIISMKN